MPKGINTFVYLFLRDDAFFNLDPLSAMEEKMWVSQEETSGAGGRRRRRRRRRRLVGRCRELTEWGEWNMGNEMKPHTHTERERTNLPERRKACNRKRTGGNQKATSKGNAIGTCRIFHFVNEKIIA